MNPSRRLSRREALKGIVGSSVAVSLAGCATNGHGNSNLIANENARPGTKDWMLRKTGVDPNTKYRCPWIEGYCSRTSVARRRNASTFTSAPIPRRPSRIDIYRMGYYGGDGARHMTTPRAVSRAHPARPAHRPEAHCANANGNPARLSRFRAIGSAASISANSPPSATAGKATSSSSCATTAAPISSSNAPTRPGRPTTAGPANSRSTTTARRSGTGGRTCDVSFDRPYGKYCQILDAPLSTGSGEWFLWEFPLAYWTGVARLRRHLHLQPRYSRRPRRPAARKGFLSRRPRRILLDRDVQQHALGDRRRAQRRVPFRQLRLRPRRPARAQPARRAIGAWNASIALDRAILRKSKTSPRWIASPGTAPMKTCSWARAASRPSRAARIGPASCRPLDL